MYLSAIEYVLPGATMSLSELEAAGQSKGGWWGWSQGKEILEWLNR